MSVALLLLFMFCTTHSAIATPSDTLSADRGLRGTAYAEVARQRQEAGDQTGAIRALQFALMADPDKAAHYRALGLALRDQEGAAPMAIRVLRSYIRLEADSLLAQDARRAIRALGVEPPLTPQAARRDAGYAGPEACAECHVDQYEGFIATAHARTSQRADTTTVGGTFTGDDATMWTGNPNLWYEMRATDDGLYQTANNFQNNQLGQRQERMDIVIGSGKIGQSFLSWRGDHLFQLPVSSYGDSARWVNSPGYPDGKAVFDRPIIPRCLECHSTFFQSVGHESSIHARSQYILGVTCERCHGPGARHAQLAATDTAAARQHIVHPGRLDSDLLIDICSQCHFDTGAPRRAPFAFRPGQRIAEFYAPGDGKGGVHAVSQVERLRASVCFQQSQDMSCITCHDPHQLERGDTRLFSERCQTCHAVDVCTMGPELGDAISNNCIDCHMPSRGDGSTRIQSAAGLENPLMPEHRIGIYEDATQRFLADLSKKQE